MVLAAIVILVAMGQELSALITTGLLVASALGVPIVQGFVNSERMGQVKELANGNLAAMREEMTRKDLQHAEEMTRKDQQHAQELTRERAAASLERTSLQERLHEAHEARVALATLLPPEAKPPEVEQ